MIVFLLITKNGKNTKTKNTDAKPPIESTKAPIAVTPNTAVVLSDSAKIIALERTRDSLALLKRVKDLECEVYSLTAELKKDCGKTAKIVRTSQNKPPAQNQTKQAAVTQQPAAQAQTVAPNTSDVTTTVTTQTTTVPTTVLNSNYYDPIIKKIKYCARIDGQEDIYIPQRLAMDLNMNVSMEDNNISGYNWVFSEPNGFGPIDGQTTIDVNGKFSIPAAWVEQIAAIHGLQAVAEIKTTLTNWQPVKMRREGDFFVYP
jgi:hypothetical protein